MSCGNPFPHPVTWEEVESEEGGQFCVLFIFIVPDNRVTSTRQVFFMIEVVLLSKTLLMATRFFFILPQGMHSGIRFILGLN